MGIFSHDYESAGAGISKHAPKKQGFALFFEIFTRKFWKILEVNLLYFLFWLPLILAVVAFFLIPNHYAALITAILLLIVFSVLIGPATAGITKIMRNYVLEKHSFIFRDFKKGFKDNFGKSAVVGIVDILICLSVFAGFKVYPQLAEQLNTKLMYVPFVISLSVALVIVMMNFYVFLMIIATDLSFKNLVKNSFALAFVEIKKSFLTLFLYIMLLGLLLFLVPIQFLLFILPFFPFALLCFISCFICYPAIQKYVINPYYTSIGQINPELCDESDEEAIFEDMGGKEKPIEKRKKGKGKRIS
ncbi:MAG: DUF624 domain-containing protein [Ruminococcus sp.]|nr:DUF624 domain-containing protein [Ruminococcus sp.]